MSLSELTAAQKEEFATSLAVLVCHDSEAEISAENLVAALKASKNKVASYLPTLYADLINKGLKVDKFLAGPSAGGAPAGGGAAGGAAAAAAPKVEEKEEEEEADLGGGMDMFGGGSDY